MKWRGRQRKSLRRSESMRHSGTALMVALRFGLMSASVDRAAATALDSPDPSGRDQGSPTLASESEVDPDELAKKLQNPVAALISVPFQFNWDTNLGPDEDENQVEMIAQPVLPFALTNKWNLISRTLVPVS